MNENRLLHEFETAMITALEWANTRNESISQAFAVLVENPGWAKMDFIHHSYTFGYSLKLYNDKWYISE